MGQDGPVNVIDVPPKTVTMDEDKIRNEVSVDQDTVAPTARNTPSGESFTQSNNTTAECDQPYAIDSNPDGENVAEEPREHAVDRIVRHVCEQDKNRYVLHSYDNTSAEDTVERPENIPTHFISRYGPRMQKEDRSQHEQNK